MHICKWEKKENRYRSGLRAENITDGRRENDQSGANTLSCSGQIKSPSNIWLRYDSVQLDKTKRSSAVKVETFDKLFGPQFLKSIWK